MGLVAQIPPMLPGALVAMAGMATLIGLLFSSGGANKSKQFGVLSDLAAGRMGAAKRTALVVALVMIGGGSCGLFVGVSVGDRQRADACARTCTERGYANAKIQGSSERNPPGSSRHAYIACVCTGGPQPDPFELRADSLEE